MIAVIRCPLFVATAIGAIAFVSQMAMRDCQAQTVTTVKDVLERWHAREGRYRSVRIEWTEQFTEVAVTSLSGAAGDSASEPSTAPSGAITKERQYSLVLDALKVRHSSLGEKFSPITGAPVYLSKPYTSVFDGAKSYGHFDRGTSPGPNSEMSLGFVHNGYQERDNYHIDPIVYHYRALATVLTGIDENDLSLVSKKATLGGDACLVLRRDARARAVTEFSEGTSQPETPAAPMLLYVDPARECVIRRYELIVPPADTVFVAVDIEYRRDPRGDWVPLEWKGVMRFQDGRFRQGTTARVQEYELNPKVDANEFTYAFPADTLVTDTTNPSGTSRYVERDGGKRRVVTPEESASGAPDNFPEFYNELVRTESGQAISRGRKRVESPQRRFWIMSGVGFGIVLLAMIWKWRRRRAQVG